MDEDKFLSSLAGMLAGAVIGGGVAFTMGEQPIAGGMIGAALGKFGLALLMKGGSDPLYCDYCGKKADQRYPVCQACNAALPDLTGQD